MATFNTPRIPYLWIKVYTDCSNVRYQNVFEFIIHGYFNGIGKAVTYYLGTYMLDNSIMNLMVAITK